MFTSDITLNTHVYSLTSQRTTSSTRRDSAQPVSEPNELSIAHETAKNGRVSTAVILDDTKIVSVPGATVPVKDTVRVLFKVQYNPFGGRTTNATDIALAIADLVSFLNTPANITKLLNQES